MINPPILTLIDIDVSFTKKKMNTLEIFNLITEGTVLQRSEGLGGSLVLSGVNI